MAPVQAAMLPPKNLWREFMPQAFQRYSRLQSAAEDHIRNAIERPFGSAARHVSQLSGAPLRCSNASDDAVLGTVEKALSIARLRRVFGYHPILLVDCDPTGALSARFGVFPTPEKKTIYHAMLERGTSLKRVIRSLRHGLDLAPASRYLSAAELLLPQEAAGDVMLCNTLQL